MEKTIEKRGIWSGAAWLAFSTVFVKFMGLLYKIPMAHILTDEGMGYFNAAYTVYSLLYLLGTAGVPKAITVLISGCVSDAEENKSRIFRVACRFFLALGLVLFLSLFLLSRPIAYWIGSPNAYPAILLISPCLLLVSLVGVYRGYLTSEGDFATLAIASLVEACAKLLIGLAFIWVGSALGLSLPWLCALSVLGIGAGTLLSTVYLKRHIKVKKERVKAEQFELTEHKKVVKNILHIALPITLGSLMAGVSSLIDLSMIMKRLEAAGFTVEQATAAYGNYTTLAVPMLQLASALLAPITVVLLPRLANAWAQNARGEYESAIWASGEVGAFFSVPLAFVFCFFPQELLALVFPTESAANAAPLLRLLSVGVIFLSLLLILNTALEAAGGARLQMLSMLVGVAVKIPISYFFLSRADYGIVGAPIGTVASYAASFVFSYFCFGKITRTQFPLFSSHWLPMFNALLATLGGMLIARFFRFSSADRIGGLVSLCVFGAVYLIFSYLTGVLRAEKIKNVAKRTKRST